MQKVERGEWVSRLHANDHIGAPWTRMCGPCTGPFGPTQVHECRGPEPGSPPASRVFAPRIIINEHRSLPIKLICQTDLLLLARFCRQTFPETLTTVADNFKRILFYFVCRGRLVWLLLFFGAKLCLHDFVGGRVEGVFKGRLCAKDYVKKRF